MSPIEISESSLKTILISHLLVIGLMTVDISLSIPSERPLILFNEELPQVDATVSSFLNLGEPCLTTLPPLRIVLPLSLLSRESRFVDDCLSQVKLPCVGGFTPEEGILRRGCSFFMLEPLSDLGSF